MQSDVCVVDVPSAAALELTAESDKRGLRIVVKVNETPIQSACSALTHPVRAQDLRYTVHSNTKKGTKVCILNGVSAWFERGEMAAVVGQPHLHLENSRSVRTCNICVCMTRATSSQWPRIALRPTHAALRCPTPLLPVAVPLTRVLCAA
jgi:hypothetical protein